MEIKDEKREIRKRVLALRDSLSREEWERGTLLVTERLLGHQWFYGCEDFLCFASYGSEIGTGELIEEALRLGKRVYAPKVERSGGVPSMEFYRIFSREELTGGFRGIPEPSGETERYVCSEKRAEKTLLLMPGAAFDGCKNRIGYGKGFYDRYLADKEALRLHSVAIGFRCQLVEEIPAEETDIRPYQVICV